MAKPISISMIADASDVAKGIKKGALEPLEDLQDRFSDAARKGEESGKSIVDAYRDVSPATEKAAERVERLEDKLDEARKASKQLGDTERDVKGLGDELDKTAKSADKMGDAGKRIGDGVKRGADEASEGVQEFGEEADSVAKEAATSFDGSAESIADIFRDLAANSLAGFGPAAAVAGIAVAAGVGIGIAELEKMAEKANEAKEAQGELALELLEVDGKLEALDLAGKIAEWSVAIADDKQWWEMWQESATSNLDQVKAEADRTGMSLEDMLLSMSGYAPDVAVKMLEDLEAQTASLRKEAEKYADTPVGSPNGYLTLEKQITANEALAEKIKETNGLTDEALQIQELLSDATAATTAETERLAAAEEAAAEAAAKAAEDRNSLLDELDGSLDKAASSWADYQDAETQALDPAAYLENVAARTQALSNYTTNIAAIADQVSPETLNAVMAQGLDFAPMLQSIIDSGLVGQMDDTFSQGAKASQEAIDSIDGTVKVDADTSAVDTALITAKSVLANIGGGPDVTLQVDADTTPADSSTTAYVDAANGQTVSMNVAAVTDGADAQLEELAKDRSATLNISADPYSANADWAALEKDRQATLVIGADGRAAARAKHELSQPFESTLRIRPDAGAAHRAKAALAQPSDSTHHISPDARAAYRVLNDLHGTVTRSTHIVEIEERTTRRYRP